MKTTAAVLPVITLLSPSSRQSNSNFSHAATQREIQNLDLLTDLYRKFEDEPDFDCEFLHAAHNQSENESIIDPESEDDLLDEFDDNQWDADIYDPYLESTYY